MHRCVEGMRRRLQGPGQTDGAQPAAKKSTRMLHVHYTSLDHASRTHINLLNTQSLLMETVPLLLDPVAESLFHEPEPSLLGHHSHHRTAARLLLEIRR